MEPHAVPSHPIRAHWRSWFHHALGPESGWGALLPDRPPSARSIDPAKQELLHRVGDVAQYVAELTADSAHRSDGGDRYPLQSQVGVFYNPDDPAGATLSPAGGVLASILWFVAAPSHLLRTP